MEVRGDGPDSDTGLPVFRAVLALQYVLDGQAEESQRILDELKRDALHFPLDVVWLTGNVLAAEVAALLDDREAAQLLYDRLLPYGSQIAQTRTNCQGSVAHYLGLLATTLGLAEEAERHLMTARDINLRLPSPWNTARTLVALARLIRARDVDEARQLTADALDLARRYGMGVVEADATAVASTLDG